MDFRRKGPQLPGMIDANGTKPGLLTHEDPAYNAEPPVHRLDTALTPIERLFVRNNGRLDGVDLAPERWRLTIDGEVERPFSLMAAELERDFPIARVTSVLECAGNGRSLYAEKTDGLPWGLGAVGCLVFEGVRLADILARAGVKPAAVYLGHESPDRHPPASPLSRAGCRSPRRSRRKRSSPSGSMASRCRRCMAGPCASSRPATPARPGRSGSPASGSATGSMTGRA